MNWETKLLLLAIFALLVGASYYALVRKEWGRRAWQALKDGREKMRVNRTARRAAAPTITPTDPGADQPTPFDWEQVRRNFRNRKFWLLLLGVEVMFTLLWFPSNFLRFAVELVTIPADYRDLISFWLRPPLWWWGLGVLFWAVLVLEHGTKLDIFLPSKDYEKRYPPFQILLFWGSLLGVVLVFPHLVWTIISPFWLVGALLLWFLWLVFVLLHWFRKIEAGTGVCVLFVGRPFQDHTQPGLAFVPNFLFLRRIFGGKVGQLMVAVPINTETHDSPPSEPILFRIGMGGATPQTKGTLSFIWKIRPPFGNFLRRVPTAELIGAVSDGEDVSTTVDLIGIAFKSGRAAMSRIVMDQTEATRLRVLLDKAIQERQPTDQVDAIKRELETAQQQGVDKFVQKINQLTRRPKSQLRRLGIAYRFLLEEWEWPEQFGRAQDHLAATRSRKEADDQYARQMRQTFQPGESGDDLFTRFAALAMSLLDKHAGRHREGSGA